MLGVAAQRIARLIRKPRNNADEAIAPKPGGTGLSGRSALSRRSPMGPAIGWRRLVHLIPESLRRDHAGLVQRFLSAHPLVAPAVRPRMNSLCANRKRRMPST